MRPPGRMKPLLIIKAGQTFEETRRTLGDFDDWIVEKLGPQRPPVRVVDAYRHEAIPSEACAAIVTGSHRMVSDCEPWSEAIAGWLRAHVDRIPLLGICYGHQLLAHACGGRVGFHARGAEIGTAKVRSTAEAAPDSLFAGLKEFPAHVAHRQTVLKLPAGAVCLASNAFEPHHAFRMGKQAWGVQFHPEFDERVARDYVIQQKEVLEAENQDILLLLTSICPTPESSALLKRFAALAAD